MLVRNKLQKQSKHLSYSNVFLHHSRFELPHKNLHTNCLLVILLLLWNSTTSEVAKICKPKQKYRCYGNLDVYGSQISCAVYVWQWHKKFSPYLVVPGRKISPCPFFTSELSAVLLIIQMVKFIICLITYRAIGSA